MDGYVLLLAMNRATYPSADVQVTGDCGCAGREGSGEELLH